METKTLTLRDLKRIIELTKDFKDDTPILLIDADEAVDTIQSAEYTKGRGVYFRVNA